MSATDRDGDGRTELPTTRQLIERAFAREDIAEVFRLIESRPLETWFAFTSPELDTILGAIPAEDAAGHPVLQAFKALLTGEELPGFDWDGSLPGDADSEHASGSHTGFRMLIASLYHRTQGDVRKAVEINRAHPRSPGRLSLIDASQGRDLFLAVQAGIAEMLVGDYQRALTHFTSAELLPVKAELRFLVRDASVKAALIHALFGDHYTAHALLKRAALIKRTDSWAERGIDVSIALIKILLKRDLTAQSTVFRQLDELPLRDLGEMWPFYIIAMQRLYMRVDKNEEFIARIRLLEQSAFPRVPGEGVPGTVFPANIAVSALLLGNLEFARSVIGEADPEVPDTRIVLALIALWSGEHARAIQLAHDLEPLTRALRQLEIWRTLILGTAMIESGDNAGGALELRRLVQRMGNLGAHELGLASPEIAAILRSHAAGGQRRPGDTDSPSDFALPGEIGRQKHAIPLTPREFDVLRLAREGLRRDEIADRLFVSVNTVKTHQRGLFKKLQVRSTRELVFKAEQLGLFEEH